MALFKKNRKIAKNGIKKMDTLITGLILWGVVASIYGIKKLDEMSEKNEAEMLGSDSEATPRKGFFKRIFSVLFKK